MEFRLELTTPACPVKDQFERDALAAVRALQWVTDVRFLAPAAALRVPRRSRGRFVREEALPRSTHSCMLCRNKRLVLTGAKITGSIRVHVKMEVRNEQLCFAV